MGVNQLQVQNLKSCVNDTEVTSTDQWHSVSVIWLLLTAFTGWSPRLTFVIPLENSVWNIAAVHCRSEKPGV